MLLEEKIKKREDNRTIRIGKLRVISTTRLWSLNLYTCGLSTSSSSTALMRKSHLVASFALRCFQRLSIPDVATLPYTWRHNRFTSGPSNPVLSY